MMSKCPGSYGSGVRRAVRPAHRTQWTTCPNWLGVKRLLFTTRIARLFRRTLYRTIWAEYTTVLGLGLHQLFAGRAFVKPLACICWH